MLLRNVTPDDVDAYVRMRCDPAMMGDLGGPLPREGIRDKVLRDAREAAADLAWIKMIVPAPGTPDVVAGNVTIWSYDTDDGAVSEIGWMVLPEFQGGGWESAPSGPCSNRPGTRTAGVSCTPSRPRATEPRTASAARSASGSSANAR